jgi:hypothetical protein
MTQSRACTSKMGKGGLGRTLKVCKFVQKAKPLAQHRKEASQAAFA